MILIYFIIYKNQLNSPVTVDRMQSSSQDTMLAEMRNKIKSKWKIVKDFND